jgi:hypothetical protein
VEDSSSYYEWGFLFNREGKKICEFVEHDYGDCTYHGSDILKAVFNNIRESLKIFQINNNLSLSDFLYNRYTNELDLKGVEQLIIDNGGELIYDKN